jgi:hypothetical protein
MLPMFLLLGQLHSPLQPVLIDIFLVQKRSNDVIDLSLYDVFYLY